MPTCFAGLMCHAPIVIPAVAGHEAERCQRTTRAMREVAHRAVASEPDRIVLISPHSPRHRHAWGAWRGQHIGDLGAFRNPQIRVDLPDAPEVARDLGLPETGGKPLDHGAMVPLSFLWDAGWRGPTAILALPWEADDHEEIGRRIAALPGRTALIASGDMSHRLKRGAPAGYHPHAQDFDHGFVAALKAEDWVGATRVPWQQEAAEDVVDSSRVAMGAAGGPLHAEVLSYEGPWGVGYTEAVFFDPFPPSWAVARQAVRAAVERRRYAAPEGGPGPAGAFVTLRKSGKLRGCIGHIEPVADRLYAEVAMVARSAATQDPRFDPVRPDEVDALQIEVSVLQAPEPIDGPESLDPARFGVIVSSGRKRGVLLPDVDGITTVEDQVSIACRKAGIRPGSAVDLERFEVTKEVPP